VSPDQESSQLFHLSHKACTERRQNIINRTQFAWYNKIYKVDTETLKQFVFSFTPSLETSWEKLKQRALLYVLKQGFPPLCLCSQGENSDKEPWETKLINGRTAIQKVVTAILTQKNSEADC
jgi:hypothetical protein